MANIRKSFNLRSGVQVDEDNLLVNSCLLYTSDAADE